MSSNELEIEGNINEEEEDDDIDKKKDLASENEEENLKDEEENDESKIHSSKESETETSENQNVIEISYENKLHYFSDRLTIEKKEKMMNVFRVFIKQLELHNLTYMAYGGTLVGINRHHGLVPWDNDIDVLIDSRQKELMKHAMRKLRKTYKLYVVDEENQDKWKFFSLNGLNAPGFDFKYPYIDIFSMREISKDVVIVENEGNLNLELNSIYPLIKRPFNGIAVYSPCNIDRILKNTYTTSDKCSSPFFSHEFETSLDIETINIDCNILKGHFPFVKRYSYNNSGKIYMKEVLIRNQTVLQIVKYSMPDECTNKRSFYPSDLEITIFNN